MKYKAIHRRKKIGQPRPEAGHSSRETKAKSEESVAPRVKRGRPPKRIQEKRPEPLDNPEETRTLPETGVIARHGVTLQRRKIGQTSLDETLIAYGKKDEV